MTGTRPRSTFVDSGCGNHRDQRCRIHRHGGAMEVGELFSAKDENRGSRGDGHAGSFSAIAANRKGDYPIRAGGQEIGENRMKGFIRLIAEYVGQCLHDAPRDLFYVVLIPVQHGPGR